MSNRDRIARAAEEAQLRAAEKAEKTTKKPAKKAPAGRSGSSAQPARMKIVWDVCDGAGKAVKTFAYPDKALAEAEMDSRTRSSGRPHTLRASKVPM
jgi:hypothetical protein